MKRVLAVIGMWVAPAVNLAAVFSVAAANMCFWGPCPVNPAGAVLLPLFLAGLVEALVALVATVRVFTKSERLLPRFFAVLFAVAVGLSLLLILFSGEYGIDGGGLSCLWKTLFYGYSC